LIAASKEKKGAVNMSTKHRPTIWTVLIASLILLSGCATSQSRPGAAGEVFITASHEEKPDWVTQTLESTDDYEFYRGRAEETVASERVARELAMDDIQRQVAVSASSRVKRNMERASLSMGLSAAVVDPTLILKSYERIFSVYVTSQIKEKEVYWERWQVPTGVGYKLHMLATVPKKAVGESIKQTAILNMKKAQQEAREATTEEAKKQAEDTIKYWKRLIDEGIIE
jgi:hypothetical protein